MATTYHDTDEIARLYARIAELEKLRPTSTTNPIPPIQRVDSSLPRQASEMIPPSSPPPPHRSPSPVTLPYDHKEPTIPSDPILHSFAGNDSDNFPLAPPAPHTRRRQQFDIVSSDVEDTEDDGNQSSDNNDDSGTERDSDDDSDKDADDHNADDVEGAMVNIPTVSTVPPPDPNAFISPSGQYKSKDKSKILQLEPSAYARKGDNQRPSVAPLLRTQSTMSEDCSNLPTGSTPTDTSQTEMASNSSNSQALSDIPPSEACSTSSKDKRRNSRSYAEILRPTQYKIFFSNEMTAALWSSVSFDNPFLTTNQKSRDASERFKNAWRARVKDLPDGESAPYDSAVHSCVSNTITLTYANNITSLSEDLSRHVKASLGSLERLL